MTNQVTYTIDLKPENAATIDAINRILLGEDYTSDQSTKKPVLAKTQEVTSNKSDTKSENSSANVTLDELKQAAKKAKADHGEDFAMEVLKTAGVEVAATLGRSMSKIDEDMYEAIIAAWEEGPQPTEQSSDEPEDDLDDDGFDDEEDTSEVTAEAVKTALKSYAKEVGRDEAKEIMQKHGAATLSKVDDCTPKQLKAMFAELV